jgi:ubiquinone/menaquinone biosynthesis C-methylase UbiE
MSIKPSDYVFDSSNECERLERQAKLQGIERHLRHFQLQPGARVLDGGCGSGAMARLLASRHPAVQVVGIDLNPGYIAYARNRATAEELGNLTFEAADLAALPLADASFDVVWSHLVLYFLPHPDVALREFRRVLRPGGTLLIALHDSPLLTNFPEDPDIQMRLERVMPGLGAVRLARKLPLMLRDEGFRDITVVAEMDAIYTILGRIGPAHRRNLEEILASALPRISEILGGCQQAEAFRTDLLAYFDRPDTCSYTTLWVVEGTAPGGLFA